MVLAWDEETGTAPGMVGISYSYCGGDPIGEIVWIVGKDMKRWLHLMDDIERFLKDMKCVECRPHSPLALERVLKSRGYRPTHVIMEKVL